MKVKVRVWLSGVGVGMKFIIADNFVIILGRVIYAGIVGGGFVELFDAIIL
jgi:hypothetical protein